MLSEAMAIPSGHGFAYAGFQADRQGVCASLDYRHNLNDSIFLGATGSVNRPWVGGLDYRFLFGVGGKW